MNKDQDKPQHLPIITKEDEKETSSKQEEKSKLAKLALLSSMKQVSENLFGLNQPSVPYVYSPKEMTFEKLLENYTNLKNGLKGANIKKDEEKKNCLVYLKHTFDYNRELAKIWDNLGNRIAEKQFEGLTSMKDELSQI